MNGYYVLTGNIDLTAAGSNSQRATAPIGYGSLSGQAHTGYTEFNGTIDGRGYAIQNLEFNWRAGMTNHDHALIDVIGANGTIKNLALTGIQAKLTKGARVAGIAWKNEGTIENCFVEYTHSGNVTGSGSQWGQAAMVLINNGAITDCLVKANVTVDLANNYICIAADNAGTMANVNTIATVVGDGDVVSINSNKGTATDTRVYQNIADFYTNNGDDKYTSAYWGFDETNATISFGKNVVVS